MPDEITGVEETETPAAGETTEESDDLFDYLGEEEGDKEDETDAGSETEDEEEEETDEEDEVEEEDDDKFDDPKTEKAFAKRLAAREAKLREELRNEILDEVRKQSPQNQQQPVNQATIKEQVEKLADQLAITPEAAQVMYNQQLMINQLYGHIQKTEDSLAESQDVTTKSQAKLDVETKRAANPLLPEFDEARLTAIRKQYQKSYGVNLPWQEAYNFLVAEEAMSGKFNRKVQQETLKNVGKRQKKTVKVKTATSAKKPTLDALSDEQFERMVERAKAGEFKKS